jgi:hypothetical protein
MKRNTPHLKPPVVAPNALNADNKSFEEAPAQLAITTPVQRCAQLSYTPDFNTSYRPVSAAREIKTGGSIGAAC